MGIISLESDMNTVLESVLNKSETPGLGAEIEAKVNSLLGSKYLMNQANLFRLP
jgi:Na+-transporting NADH:ubiquinone oxidoreductase subunit NqrC